MRYDLAQLADFAGGSLMCVIGVLMALFERTRSVSVAIYYRVHQ